MRLVALAVIFLILVLGGLIALRMTQSANRKKEEWSKLSNRATLAESILRQISKEIKTAQSAGMTLDIFILDNMLEEYEIDLAQLEKKEMVR